MKREETNGEHIRPGDVYTYNCHNDQGYGYMIPVKTSNGWDFIDTYQLNIPSRKDGETGDGASIRRIIELGDGEHDGYVSGQTSMFYHRNAYFGRASVPYGLRFAFNLNDYDAASSRECENYDDGDVVYHVPLYREQHYSWNSGRALGLCFVRKGAEKDRVNEFRSLLGEASGSIVTPYAGSAASLLNGIKEKLNELEDLGLSTQRDEDDVSYLAKRIEIIGKCTKDLEETRREHFEQEARREHLEQLWCSDGTGDERTANDESGN